MGLTEPRYEGLDFGDIHNIYARHLVSTPKNIFKNQNRLSRIVSFLGITATIITDNQIIIFPNTPQLRYLRVKIVFRTNTRIYVLNRSLLKYDKFINILMAIYDIYPSKY